MWRSGGSPSLGTDLLPSPSWQAQPQRAHRREAHPDKSRVRREQGQHNRASHRHGRDYLCHLWCQG